ncbi:MAG: carboxypeptidase-like regulatory domain-containing protein, partial [Candidatus Korobacteraceae bacterium]
MALLLCCAAFPAWGQTTTAGTLTGLVTDQSNAVVPDATVSIKDVSSSMARSTTTNASGRYV